MHKLYIDTNLEHRFIVYKANKSNKKKTPYIIFLHGLMSNMHSTKAMILEQYCLERDLNYIRFDNFGRGDSSGKFIDQNITNWLEGLRTVINKLTEDEAKIILVGSSAGGWLSLIAGKLFAEKLIGIITIAAAVDFTEILWNKLSQEQQLELKINNITSVGEGELKYEISYGLIQDAKQYMTNYSHKIVYQCPVHLICGAQDTIVSHQASIRYFSNIKSQAILKIINDADHSLSRVSDMQVITNSIEEILLSYNNHASYSVV